MWATFGSLSVVPWILFAQMSWDMSAVPVITTPHPSTEMASVGISDRDGVFSPDAKRRANAILRQIQRDHRVPVFIETFQSLGGVTIDDVARHRPRPIGSDGIYVLVASQERDVAVLFNREATSGRLTERDRAVIRAAFLNPLRAGDADWGLGEGVRGLAHTLANAAATRPKPGIGDSLIAFTILLGVWTVLIATRVGENHNDRIRRQRKVSSHARNGREPILLN